MQREVLAYQEEQSLPEKYMKVGVKKLLRAGMMPARTCGAHAVGMSPTEVLIEETDGSCGGKKRARPPCLCSWKFSAWKWKMRFLPWPLSVGQKEYGQENGVASTKEAWLRQIR